MRILKVLVYGFAIIGVAYVAFSLYLSFGPVASCEINAIKSVVSPNEQQRASLIIEKCKDKSGPTLVLSISDRSKPRHQFDSEIGVATTTDVDLTWLSDHSLQLTYPSAFHLTQQPSSLGGIDVKFSIKAVSDNSFKSNVASGHTLSFP